MLLICLTTKAEQHAKSNSSAEMKIVAGNEVELLPTKDINSTKQQNFGFNQFETFAGNNSYVAEIKISLCDRVESVVEKRRKCWLPEFSPLPTMYSKGLFL